MSKKIIAFLLVLIALLVLPGCWGKRELNEITIVTATGFDVEKNGDMRITILATVPTGGPTTSGSEKANTLIATATGKSIMDASKNLRGTVTRKLVFFHSTENIIGEELAKKGVAEPIDFCLRNREIRISSNVFVCKGRADTLLEQPADVLEDLSGRIEGLTNNTDEWSKTTVANVKDITIAMGGKNKGTVTGRLITIDTSRRKYSTYRQNIARESRKDEKIQSVLLSGGAVFKEDKLVGWLNGRETRGYLWVSGKVKTAVLVIKGPGKGEMTMQTDSEKTDIKPRLIGGKVYIEVKVRIKGRLVEDSSKVNLQNQKDLSKTERRFAQAAETDIRMVLKRAQKDYKDDIFDFGGYVMRAYPEQWKKMEKKWGQIFPKVQVRYHAEVSIHRVGEIGKPVLMIK